MSRALNEFKAGWNEVRWANRFLFYLLLTTALAVLIAYSIEGKFTSPPSLLLMLLVSLGGLISLYYAVPQPPTELVNKAVGAYGWPISVLSTKFSMKWAKFRRRRSNNNITASPLPGESLLHLLLPENVIGDIQEHYRRISKKYGRRRAEIWFFRELALSVYPLFLKLLIQLLAVANLVEIVRKLIAR